MNVSVLSFLTQMYVLEPCLQRDEDQGMVKSGRLQAKCEWDEMLCVFLRKRRVQMCWPVLKSQHLGGGGRGIGSLRSFSTREFEPSLAT